MCPKGAIRAIAELTTIVLIYLPLSLSLSLSQAKKLFKSNASQLASTFLMYSEWNWEDGWIRMWIRSVRFNAWWNNGWERADKRMYGKWWKCYNCVRTLQLFPPFNRCGKFMSLEALINWLHLFTFSLPFFSYCLTPARSMWNKKGSLAEEYWNIFPFFFFCKISTTNNCFEIKNVFFVFLLNLNSFLTTDGGGRNFL